MFLTLGRLGVAEGVGDILREELFGRGDIIFRADTNLSSCDDVSRCLCGYNDGCVLVLLLYCSVDELY